ncbi:unnamed protein product [Oikopleura dioica]|uniref:RING-type domain-containing protein n=1 Tax=Oikopleura dioica TaxID=34765 RepID=E4YQI0_OIKDI|nr:unnamed protein product [Oikopleura dioica]
MLWWAVPREFVISSGGICGKCKEVTMFFISRTEKESNQGVFRNSYDFVTGCYDKLCFNCLSSYLENFPKSRYQLSGGSFKCPAYSCIGGMSFETFIKRECCPAAQSLWAKETFAKLDGVLEKVKKNSSASDIATVSGKLFANFFPKTGDDAKCKNAKKQLQQLGDHLQIVKYNCKAEAIETVSEELDSFIEKFSNFFPKNDRNSCAICLEKYDDKKRIECTLLCGHRSCFECLTQLPNKNCPTCRKAFTNEQIIKLF